jgi:hypothetical protein
MVARVQVPPKPQGSEDLESISEVEAPPGEESSESQRSSLTPDGADSPPDESLEVVAAPGAVDFKHPLLKGKTPEEVEALVAAQQAALVAQNTELNRRHAEATPQPAAPTPARSDDASPYGDDFLAPRFKVLEERVTDHLGKMIEPLMRGAARSEGEGTRGKLRGELKHFTVLEPHIDALLREQKLDPATVKESQLRTIYHTAVGIATEQGINLSTAASAPAPAPEAPPTREAPPIMIPQHRPSAAPLPARPGPARRVLSEEERMLAKVYFPASKDPEADYIALQDAPEDAVVQPGFSKDRW